MAQLSDRVRVLMQPHFGEHRALRPEFHAVPREPFGEREHVSHACCGARVHRRRARGHAA